MKKCKGCGTWWREDDRRLLSGRMPLPPMGKKRCRSSGRNVSDCCSNHPGDYCSKCNRGG